MSSSIISYALLQILQIHLQHSRQKYGKEWFSNIQYSKSSYIRTNRKWNQNDFWTARTNPSPYMSIVRPRFDSNEDRMARTGSGKREKEHTPECREVKAWSPTSQIISAKYRSYFGQNVGTKSKRMLINMDTYRNISSPVSIGYICNKYMGFTSYNECRFCEHIGSSLRVIYPYSLWMPSP